MEKPQLFQYPTAFLLVVSLILLVPWLGLREFSTRGEAREALVAQRMMLTDDYILPRSYDEEVPSKPPMLHWFINGASLFTGEVTETTSRLPSAIAAICFILGFHLFLAKRGYDSLLPPLILLSCFEWFRAATATRVDELLATFFAGALLCLYSWFESGFKKFPIFGILLLGCAALTKGPVGLVLPLGIFGLFLLTQRVPFYKIIGYCVLIAVPAGFIASLWYGAAYLTDGEPFLAMVYDENVARFTGTMDGEPHKHSAVYLYGTILTGLMPWTLIVIPGLVAAFVKKRRDVVALDAKNDTFILFSLITSLVIVAFFSIPASKRSVYLLPAYPFFAFLISQYVSIFIETFPDLIRKVGALASNVIVALCVTLLGLIYFQTDFAFIKIEGFVAELREAFQRFEFFFLLVITLCLGGAFYGYRIIRKQQGKQLFISVLMLFLAPYFLIQAIVLPPTSNALSYRSFADETRGIVSSEDKLYSYEDAFYGFSFYLKKQFDYLYSPAEAPQEGYVYLFERNLESFKAGLPADRQIQVLARSTKFVVKNEQHVLLIKVVPRV